MTAELYPALRAMLGGWFHQDFDVGGTVPEIIAHFAASAPAGTVAAVQADISRFLLDDPEGADAAFERLGAEIWPQGWGMDAASWLRWVATLLQQAVMIGRGFSTGLPAG